MLRLAKVEKRYGGETVLGPVTPTFEAVKTCVLIGPSGSGRCRLLRLLIGLERRLVRG